MNLISSIFKRSYYKIRIIVTFSIFTIALVIIMSVICFHFIRNLYLEQMADQLNILSRITANQIDRDYVKLLQVGVPVKSTQDYFNSIFIKYTSVKPQLKMFIFDNNFKVIVHSDTSILLGTTEPRLLLNQNDIIQLKNDHSAVSLPFKGDDGKWYLWGFYKMNDIYWLSIQESADKLEKVEDFSILFWIIGISGTIATIILGWIAAGSISKPIDRLVEFSSEIGKGNTSFPVPHKMKGEIEVLAGAMEKMRRELFNSQKEKENMLAQIAHEIRNPLGGIELLANLTREDILNNITRTEYLDKILDEINGLKQLITSYLNYSRPVPSNPVWIDFNDFFCDLEKIFREKLIKKKIRLTFTDTVRTIYFDPAHLRHIMMNLISNSIEAIQASGNISIYSLKENNNWKIIVKDDGPGIDKEDLGKIFEPFFTTRKNGQDWDYP